MNPYEEVETPLAHVDVVTEGKKLRAHQDAMQKKTFTKWYNSYLQQRNLKVDDLFKDVGDGLILHNLVELLAQEKNPQKAQQNPRFTAQKLENIQAALNHIKRKGVAVESIGSSEIANGSEVFVLGLSWMLILRFEVQKFSADTQELLRWCKRRTADYPNVKVDNFTTSFQDGLALNALIHKHAPELIDYESLDPSNTLANIQNALDVAERELGVPKLLDANDLMNTPEEKSVITYVARLRDALSTREEQFKLEEMKADEEARKKAAEEQARKKAADEEARLLAAEQARKKAEEDARLRAEAEARRKAEEEAARLAAEEAARKRAEEAARRKAEDDERRMAADRNKSIEELNDLLPQFVNREKQELETDKLVADYNLRAKELADWIHQRDDKLKDNVNHNKLGDTLEEVEGNIDHLRDDVDQKEKEKLDLETLNNAINTRLKMENRPRPVHEVPMEQVNNLWNQASTTEQGYKKLLLDRREELLKQQVSLDRFRRFASKLEDWTTVCAEVISRAELGESIVDTTELIAEHERFSRDSKAQARTYKELGSIAKLLPGHPEVEERMRKLRSFFDPLPQRNKDRADQLQKELVRQRQIEANRLKFFEDIRDFEELLFAAEEYARNPLESDTEQAIIAVLDPLKRVASSIKPHEHFSAEEEAELNEARARYEGVAPQLEARQSAVKEDQQRKKQVEELYQKFARTSAQFATWYSKMAALIAEDGTIELLRQRAKSVQTGLGEGQTHLNNASTQQASIDSSGLVGPNPYTTATVYSLTTQFDHIKKWADDRAERMQANPPVTNHQQVVRALDVLSHDKGVINPQELSSVLPAESVDYLKRKAPANASGEVEYTKFNPYPEDTFVQRRSSTVSSGSRLSLVGSPSITPLSPQEQPKRNSVYSAPSKNRTSVHATGGQTPVISATTPVSTQASPMLTSPVIKPVSEENGAPLPHFDDSMRKRKELEENLYLYTTQTLTSPLAIRYEVEVDKHEHIEFRVSFDGSNNIRLLRPTNAFNMLAVTEVPAFKTKVVAIVQQIDPYQEASLKNKYSWSSRVI